MTTLNVFDSIKETLYIADVVAHYGVVVKRANKALCPLHNEKTPSFTIYHDSNSWHCFGCGAGGSVIDFVMAHCGLEALEAAKKLDMDFGLRLFDHKLTQEEIHRLKEQQAQKQADKVLTGAFEDYINKAYDLLCEYFHLLSDWRIMCAPMSQRCEKPFDDMNEPINPLFVESCHKLDYIEYLLDGLLETMVSKRTGSASLASLAHSASIDEQITFYETHREELLNIANRIREYKDTERARVGQGLHSNGPKADKSA